MANQIKILIGVFVITVVLILIGGIFIYNKSLAPGISLIPGIPPILEKKSPTLNIYLPPSLEIPAYKFYSLDFLIENGYPEAKDINITLKGIAGKVSPNKANIGPKKSGNFKLKLEKLEPGNYTLYLDISNGLEINIAKTISLKVQIIVGLDEYHTNELWEKKEYKEYAIMEGSKFMAYLNENGIKTEVIDSQISPATLKNINVLVIAKPIQPILSNELEELKKFLNQGGGLLLAGLFDDYMGTADFLNDIAKSLHLELRYNKDYFFGNDWTKDITKHQVTAGIESIAYRGASLNIDIPLTTLVKQSGRTVYAVQLYSNGKIGAIGGYFMFRNDHFDFCRQCQELNLNLIKWLGTPPTPEELEEMG